MSCCNRVTQRSSTSHGETKARTQMSSAATNFCTVYVARRQIGSGPTFPRGHFLSPPRPWRVRMDPVTEEEFHRSLLLTSARGHLQRAAAESRAAEPAGGGDPGLSHRLLLKWCYGHRSAIGVNTDAILAVKAGARGGYLQQLARLGAGGGGDHTSTKLLPRPDGFYPQALRLANHSSLHHLDSTVCVKESL